MSSTTLTLDQLSLSPLNVRTYRPDAEDTTALQASILADGLLNPIAVHPMKGAKNRWGAIAGGRRYRAIKALINNGDLPLDYAVRVSILEGLSDAELIEHSITENLLRRDLRDHELYAGVARAAARGHDVEQIAKGLGQPDVAKVARWLRMGQLAPPVFDALAGGELTIEQAQAFAATADVELQRVTFERLSPVSPHVTAIQIRREMKIGDTRAQRDLAFVTADAYRAAGGRFELDLFAEAAEERGRIIDDGTLQQLVEDKLASIRDQVRVTTQQRDLRFIAETPKDQWSNTDNQLAVTPKRLESGTLVLPDGEVVAHIAIDASGEPVVSYWWESRKAKFGGEKKPAAATSLPAPAAGSAVGAYGEKARANAVLREEEGLSQDATFALLAIRKMILRAALIEEASVGGEAGLDYLVWAQARMLLTDRAPKGIGMRPIAGDNTVGVSHNALVLAREQLAPTRASTSVAVAAALVMRQPFFTDPAPETAFLAYRAASKTMKTITAALVAGVALERGLAAPGYELPVHDVLAHEVDVDLDENIRTYWTPTAEFIDLFPKEQRRAIAEPFVERASFAGWAKLKSNELTAAVLTAVTRAGGAGAKWVHPLLRFTSPFPAHQLAAREAAE